MIRETGTLLLICCFCIAALPGAAPAAQTLSRQSLIKKNIAGMQGAVLAAASTDSTPLHALTVQFLDEVKRLGFKRHTADLDLAVAQYVSDMHEQAAAPALDATCAPALLISITTYGSAMLQELASYDAPVCEAISLSTSAVSIVFAKYEYDICVENTKEVPDATVIADLETRQKNIQVYSFAADVLSLAMCSASAGVQDYLNILVRFIGLFM